MKQYFNVPIALPVLPGRGDTYKNIAVTMSQGVGGSVPGIPQLFGQIAGSVLNPIGTNVYNPDKFGIGLSPLPDVTSINADFSGLSQHQSNIANPAVVIRTGVAPLSGKNNYQYGPHAAPPEGRITK